ncbi:MAG: hypothetical protein ACOCRN_03875 [Spirochaetia bacterium]
MADWIVVTDRDWFEFHKKRRREPVLFWSFANSPKARLKTIERGERFFFLLKNPKPREIAGFGVLTGKGSATLRDLWSRYGEGLGAATLAALMENMRGKRAGQSISPESRLNYYALDNVRYVAVPLRPESSYVKRGQADFTVDVFAGVEFAQSIVAGRKISRAEADRLQHKLISGEAELPAESPPAPPEAQQDVEGSVEQAETGQAAPFRSAREFFEREAAEVGWQLQAVRWDGAGWDYDAIADGEILRVKLLEAGPGPSGRMWLSPDERKRMQELRDELVVVVVSPLAEGGVSFRVFAYDAGADAWMDSEGGCLSFEAVTAYDVSIVED